MVATETMTKNISILTLGLFLSILIGAQSILASGDAHVMVVKPQFDRKKDQRQKQHIYNNSPAIKSSPFAKIGISSLPLGTKLIFPDSIPPFEKTGCTQNFLSKPDSKDFIYSEQYRKNTFFEISAFSCKICLVDAMGKGTLKMRDSKPMQIKYAEVQASPKVKYWKRTSFGEETKIFDSLPFKDSSDYMGILEIQMKTTKERNLVMSCQPPFKTFGARDFDSELSAENFAQVLRKIGVKVNFPKLEQASPIDGKRGVSSEAKEAIQQMTPSVKGENFPE